MSVDMPNRPACYLISSQAVTRQLWHGQQDHAEACCHAPGKLVPPESQSRRAALLAREGSSSELLTPPLSCSQLATIMQLRSEPSTRTPEVLVADYSTDLELRAFLVRHLPLDPDSAEPVISLHSSFKDALHYIANDQRIIDHAA